MDKNENATGDFEASQNASPPISDTERGRRGLEDDVALQDPLVCCSSVDGGSFIVFVWAKCKVLLLTANYWVGSLDFNFLGVQGGLPLSPPPKKNNTFCRGVFRNQVLNQELRIGWGKRLRFKK